LLLVGGAGGAVRGAELQGELDADKATREGGHPNHAAAAPVLVVEEKAPVLEVDAGPLRYDADGELQRAEARVLLLVQHEQLAVHAHPVLDPHGARARGRDGVPRVDQRALLHQVGDEEAWRPEMVRAEGGASARL